MIRELKQIIREMALYMAEMSRGENFHYGFGVTAKDLQAYHQRNKNS